MFLSSHVQLTPLINLSGVRTSALAPANELTLCGTADTRGRVRRGTFAES